MNELLRTYRQHCISTWQFLLITAYTVHNRAKFPFEVSLLRESWCLQDGFLLSLLTKYLSVLILLFGLCIMYIWAALPTFRRHSLPVSPGWKWVSCVCVSVYIDYWSNGVWLRLVTKHYLPPPHGSVGLKIYVHNKYYLSTVFTSTLKIEAGCASETSSTRSISTRF